MLREGSCGLVVNTTDAPVRPVPTVAKTLSAQPYMWPYHGSLDPARTALVACVDRRWRAPVPDSDERDSRLGQIARAVRASGGFVVALTATTGPPVGRRPAFSIAPETALPGTVLPGAVSAVLGADAAVEAGATNGFYSSRLDDVLRANGRTDIIVAGWGLEGPVHSTLRAGNDRGYECLLVADASTPLDPDLVFGSCEMVRFSGGIFGAFAATADVVAAFGGDPATT
jgi:nicotinamidase-related amidase